MQKTPWWLVGCGLALILFVALACVGILGAAWAFNVGGGGKTSSGPSIDSSTAAALIRAAQAEDPTAEISSAFVICSRANWTCYKCTWVPGTGEESLGVR